MAKHPNPREKTTFWYVKICKVETYCHVHFKYIGVSSNGRMMGSDPIGIGSSPVAPAIILGIGVTVAHESLTLKAFGQHKHSQPCTLLKGVLYE